MNHIKEKIVYIESDGKVEYDEKDGTGYYHTGVNSFDGPEIKHLAGFEGGTGDYQWGPFQSWAEAQADQVNMITNDIQNLKDCLSKVRRLKP